MKISKDTKIKKYMDGKCTEETDLVVAEYELKLSLNGRDFVKFTCSPDEMEELAIGYLLAESIIDSIDDIRLTGFKSIDSEKGQVEIETVESREYLFTDEARIVRTVTTACGKNRTFHLPLLKKNGWRTRYMKINYEEIQMVIKDFNARSENFKNTGGVHSSGLSVMKEILVFSEDISRHNAVDKIIGKAAINNISFDNKVLLVSGRISSEIVQKAAAVDIGCIVSRSAPTLKAIELGEKYKIVIIGFARGNRMNIYTGQ
ncbi:formate dehydrogenase accessory sulfurtransferase FdhD [Dethiosulfatibacter aminovorans]|nr:formate dehydrogenase accessory sulfurtransferase FdhD [Dethiosulfatibacter aminovorans]